MRDVAIIGAGFTGLMLALALDRRGVRASLIERTGRAGLGLAYGTAHPAHLLNVRAGNMSAFADEPGHFAEWLAARGYPQAEAMFAPRTLYGAYLRELMGGLPVVRDEAIDIARDGDGVRVALASGETVAADAAVLAVGNLPPLTPRGIDADALAPGRYRQDPWAPGVAEGLSDGDSVLLLGTGLTMVDQAILLDELGFEGRMVAISRRGLLPRSHAETGDWPRIDAPPEGPLSAMTAAVRRRAGEVGWRNAVDELRPFTQGMWQSASADAQRRFLRHLRAWWDVHRHRIAAEVHERIAGLRTSGRLAIHAGRVRSVAERGDCAEVAWTPRGSSQIERLAVQRIVNCTGPASDLERSGDPLLTRLAARGTIRADALRIGIDIDDQARTIDRGGGPNDWLLALGPMSRGAYWEIVAVPDIRVQVAEVAARLASTGARNR